MSYRAKCEARRRRTRGGKFAWVRRVLKGAFAQRPLERYPWGSSPMLSGLRVLRDLVAECRRKGERELLDRLLADAHSFKVPGYLGLLPPLPKLPPPRVHDVAYDEAAKRVTAKFTIALWPPYRLSFIEDPAGVLHPASDGSAQEAGSEPREGDPAEAPKGPR